MRLAMIFPAVPRRHCHFFQRCARLSGASCDRRLHNPLGRPLQLLCLQCTPFPLPRAAGSVSARASCTCIRFSFTWELLDFSKLHVTLFFTYCFLLGRKAAQVGLTTGLCWREPIMLLCVFSFNRLSKRDAHFWDCWMRVGWCHLLVFDLIVFERLH